MKNHIKINIYLFGVVTFQLENYFQATQNSEEPYLWTYALKDKKTRRSG